MTESVHCVSAFLKCKERLCLDCFAYCVLHITYVVLHSAYCVLLSVKRDWAGVVSERKDRKSLPWKPPARVQRLADGEIGTLGWRNRNSQMEK